MKKQLVNTFHLKSEQAHKNRLLYWAYICALAATIFLCVFFLYSKSSSPLAYVEPQTLSITTSEQTVLPTPVRLVIPKIGVNAMIESVGLTPAGAMDIPKDQFNVAWYNRGPRPGEQGSAVIDGHLDGENQTEAVFKDLKTVEIGDTVEVIDDQGHQTVFVVRKTKLYQANDDTTEIFKDTSGRYLNLITCAGRWNSDRHDYEERLVVFTELAS